MSARQASSQVPLLVLGKPVQLAYAVGDVQLAAQQWVEQFGAGPFFIRSHIPVTDIVYRGQPAAFDHSSAYGQWGEIMVELVQDHGTAPSVVRERFGPTESGLHHVAFMVADLDEATEHCADMGFALAMSAQSSSTRFHFIDAVATLGHMLELYQRSERLLGFYAMVRDAAEDWDGADPLRTIATSSVAGRGFAPGDSPKGNRRAKCASRAAVGHAGG